MGGDHVWVGLQVGTSKKAKWIRKIARYPMQSGGYPMFRPLYGLLTSINNWNGDS